MKIVTVIGARPQFIKAAVLSRTLKKRDDISEVIVHTGQHFDQNMSDVFFEEMDIPKPDYFLNINGLSHGAMTGQMMEGIEKILLAEKPDWVLVYGDTNSTLAGALAAAKLHIKVAHVEAGLRSFNMRMPEEINRILTDRISSLLFCPTEVAMKNLADEAFLTLPIKCRNVGDIMHEAALFYASRSTKPDFDLPSKFILCTLHRAENTDSPERLRSITKALKKISLDIPILFPLHPRTKDKLEKVEANISEGSNIIVIPPVGYLSMVYLLQNCELVMTDSGGLQKEAYFFRKKCVILRDETEWTELLEGNTHLLVGADEESIYAGYHTLEREQTSEFSEQLYGDGNTSQHIISAMLESN
jgi:UDP-GlcNAc3NAcA epimerase